MFAVKYIKYGSQQYEEAVKLRNEAMYKPFGKSIYDEDLSHEENCIIIGSFETNSFYTDLLTACGVMGQLDETTFVAQCVCADPILQKKGLGSAIMQCLEKIATDRGAKKLILEAPVDTIDFFQRFGFMPKGQAFSKEGQQGEFVQMFKPVYQLPKEFKEMLAKHHHHHHGEGCGHSHHSHGEESCDCTENCGEKTGCSDSCGCGCQ